MLQLLKLLRVVLGPPCPRSSASLLPLPSNTCAAVRSGPRPRVVVRVHALLSFQRPLRCCGFFFLSWSVRASQLRSGRAPTLTPSLFFPLCRVFLFFVVLSVVRLRWCFSRSAASERAAQRGSCWRGGVESSIGARNPCASCENIGAASCGPRRVSLRSHRAPSGSVCCPAVLRVECVRRPSRGLSVYSNLSPYRFRFNSVGFFFSPPFFTTFFLGLFFCLRFLPPVFLRSVYMCIIPSVPFCFFSS
jgi:hypothetical protein